MALILKCDVVGCGVTEDLNDREQGGLGGSLAPHGLPEGWWSADIIETEPVRMAQLQAHPLPEGVYAAQVPSTMSVLRRYVVCPAHQPPQFRADS